MSERKETVYMDANVIIEAHRSGCWKGLSGRFLLATVESIRDEVFTGNPSQSGYVEVDRNDFDERVTVYAVDRVTQARFRLAHPDATDLDLGERDLLAYLHTAGKQDAWLLTTADRAAVKVACQSGMNDRLVSLEEMAGRCGASPRLREHYRSVWLSRVRTDFLFDSL